MSDEPMQQFQQHLLQKSKFLIMALINEFCDPSSILNKDRHIDLSELLVDKDKAQAYLFDHFFGRGRRACFPLQWSGNDKKYC